MNFLEMGLDPSPPPLCVALSAEYPAVSESATHVYDSIHWETCGNLSGHCLRCVALSADTAIDLRGYCHRCSNLSGHCHSHLWYSRYSAAKETKDLSSYLFRNKRTQNRLVLLPRKRQKICPLSSAEISRERKDLCSYLRRDLSSHLFRDLFSYRGNVRDVFSFSLAKKEKRSVLVSFQKTLFLSREYQRCRDVSLPSSLAKNIIFHKRATKYRPLLLKMTYKDKGSYESFATL